MIEVPALTPSLISHLSRLLSTPVAISRPPHNPSSHPRAAHCHLSAKMADRSLQDRAKLAKAILADRHSNLRSDVVERKTRAALLEKTMIANGVPDNEKQVSLYIAHHASPGPAAEPILHPNTAYTPFGPPFVHLNQSKGVA